MARPRAGRRTWWAPAVGITLLLTACGGDKITPQKPYVPPPAPAPAPAPAAPAEATVYPTGDATAETQVRISETTSSLTGTNLRLADLLSVAYRTPETSEGQLPLMSEVRVTAATPLPATHYDLRIRVPGAKAPRLREELRRLLQTSFRLTARLERREANVLVLSAPLGRMQAAGRSGAPAEGSRVTLSGDELTLLTEQLEERLGQPVVNETNLRGAYVVQVPALYRAGTQRLDPDATRAALSEQLGLDLLRGRRLIEMLVVESATPTVPQASAPAPAQSSSTPPAPAARGTPARSEAEVVGEEK
jgi:uncharacterized protein (TIGR03435 family)